MALLFSALPPSALTVVLDYTMPSDPISQQCIGMRGPRGFVADPASLPFVRAPPYWLAAVVAFVPLLGWTKLAKRGDPVPLLGVRRAACHHMCRQQRGQVLLDRPGAAGLFRRLCPPMGLG